MNHHSMRFAGCAATMAIAACLVGCSHDQRSPLSSLTGPDLTPTQRIVLPFNPNNFVAGVNNPLFRLAPGTRLTYREETDEGVETDTVVVTHDAKTILGVAVTVVHDFVSLDGSLTEDTFDWYAQDSDGNVWYFGEDTKTYDHGVFVTDEGSWEAGVNNAKAGIIMLAHPKVGDQYQQEDSPGVVADEAKVLGLDETVTVQGGTFAHCLKTSESTPLEHGVREFKYYAPGVGTVLELSPKGGRHRVELTSFTPATP